MKITIEQLMKATAQREVIKADPKALEEQKQKIIAFLGGKNLLPPNDKIKGGLIQFLGEAKLNARHKGLFFIGGVGTGKTIATQIISHFKQWEFNEMVFLRDRWADEKTRTGTIDWLKNAMFNEPLVIDDVGAEESIVSYGERFESFERVLDIRYKAFKRVGSLTVMTSNLTGDQFKERYGARIYSRIREMCECIVCNGEDLRIK